MTTIIPQTISCDTPEELTREILDHLKPEEIIYAEYASTGAMGACGTARIYALQDETLHFYLATYDRKKFEGSAYAHAIDLLSRLARTEVLDCVSGGAGNIAFRRKNSGFGCSFGRSDDDYALIYYKDYINYRVDCSCLGVYREVVRNFTDLQNHNVEQIRQALRDRPKFFSAEEVAFIEAYITESEGFDRGKKRFESTPDDYWTAIKYLRYCNQEEFNFSDDWLADAVAIIASYRLKYLIQKYGRNKIHYFFADYFVPDKSEILKNPDQPPKPKRPRTKFFTKLDQTFGEKIETKFSQLQTITSDCQNLGLTPTIDFDFFGRNHFQALFEFPQLIDFSKSAHRSAIQRIEEMLPAQLRTCAEDIAFYFANYIFQDDKLSYAAVLPAAIHVVKNLPADDFNHTHTDQLFWLAGEIINNAWRALDDEKLERQYRKFIFALYWPRLGGVWPITHYDEFEFKDEATTKMFDEALSFVMCLSDVHEYSPELKAYLESGAAEHSQLDAVKKRVFEFKMRGADDPTYFNAILEDFPPFEAVRGLAYPKTIETAKFYLQELFNPESEINSYYKLPAFEQLLLSPKHTGIGKYILEYLNEHFEEFVEIVEPQNTLDLFTAACCGVTDENELKPLKIFGGKVAAISKTPAAESKISAALRLAEKNIATTKFQRAEVTKFLKAK